MKEHFDDVFDRRDGGTRRACLPRPVGDYRYVAARANLSRISDKEISSMSLDMSYYLYDASLSTELGITRFCVLVSKQRLDGSFRALDGSSSYCNEKKNSDQLVRVCIYIVS